ncbi:MAG: TRAM domain-containing protein [Candidatus Hydrothermarchaeota archaeon]
MDWYKPKKSYPTSSVEEGKVYDVTIEAKGREGDGIAKVEGMVIFVQDVKVGEKVKIKIDRVARRCAFAHREE